ncbi:hypothetical protein CEUSTIGMA_g7709.t1 [Chlamydomonas eustigma]|uniref:Uncharacterized protein n=1 Tax=Chlamydomonas eustigma TaxID=1157962 RepID=A0A250XB15_9CHLO|nr:hypothetical protein CEUSTIGMA_g7709.t1 [Chlamydomonas eustigma]|eukprot:GAX80271.1 hypothetical protein CEUSTIGMA_g7709.t1 [Chlamydomonas eustigma]
MPPQGFKFQTSIEEEHKKPIFCITFNQVDSAHSRVFASVGSNRASIYECLDGGTIDVLQVYTDEDSDESFYVCKWTMNPDTRSPLLLIAGQKGVVRLVDCGSESLVHTFMGHGNSINDISVLPQNLDLFLTASKDESVRLWNIKTKTCVLIMSGVNGHKNEVLSLDFHMWDGHRFLSSGMDNTVMIWSLEENASSIEQSMSWNDSTRSFPTKFNSKPIFSSTQIHANYVDCVRWLGNLVLSKSVDFEIVLWKPEFPSDEEATSGRFPTIATSFHLLQKFPLPDSKMWFVRFSLNCSLTLLACGNRVGKVFLYNPHEPASSHVVQLKTGKNTAVVRQTAVSQDGSIVLASCEDGSIWRWDNKVAGADLGGPSAAGYGSVSVTKTSCTT